MNKPSTNSRTEHFKILLKVIKPLSRSVQKKSVQFTISGKTSIPPSYYLASLQRLAQQLRCVRLLLLGLVFSAWRSISSTALSASRGQTSACFGTGPAALPPPGRPLIISTPQVARLKLLDQNKPPSSLPFSLYSPNKRCSALML